MFETLKRNYKRIPDKWIRLFLFYSFSLAFVLLNAWLVLKKDTLFGVLVPVVLIVVLTAIFSYRKLIWFIVFITPLSVPLEELVYGLPFDMHIPTEPLLVGIILLFIFSLAQGNRIDKRLVWHPISIAIYFYLAWMAITTVTSSMPLVSAKFLLTRVWYIVVFFFLMGEMLLKNNKDIERFIWLFTSAFVPVIIYTVVRHLGYGIYDDNAAHWVMDPFFNDHTSYGAVLAMFIPFLVGFSLAKWIPLKYRFWMWGILAFFIVAEVLSYSRAAWLSLIAAFGVWAIIRLKIKFKTIAITVVSLVLIGVVFQNQILMKLEQNSTDSSNNLTDHITSMTNISTDASNVERINRWQCAISLFQERPVFGWGPGTYAFKYAPYQLTRQRTIISTNSGDGGNAHSEYLGALADEGVLGTLSFILLIIVVIYTAITAYIRTDDKRIKTILMAALASLITYYLHSFLNNFLDTDKASVPFWSFTVMIVVLDIYSRQEKKTKEID